MAYGTHFAAKRREEQVNNHRICGGGTLTLQDLMTAIEALWGKLEVFSYLGPSACPFSLFGLAEHFCASVVDYFNLIQLAWDWLDGYSRPC